MGTKLVSKNHIDDLLEVAITNPQKNPTLVTLDRLLAAAASEEVSFTFLFLRIFPITSLLSLCTQRKVKKIGKTLLTILLKHTPDDIYVDTSAYNEYIILMPGVSKEEAIDAGKQIHRVFQEKIQHMLKEEAINAGLQGCVITFPEEAESRADLFHRARTALFLAQQTGEPCIVRAIDEENQPISCEIPKFHSERLQYLSKNEGLTQDALIKEAIDDLLQKYANMNLLRPQF
jgi:GGDEF domain-containing protein